MDDPRKHQVSLRGASAKEITRDALLEKVSQERHLRHYARPSTASALFIQRVWRRYRVTNTVAVEIREEWEKSMNEQRAGLVITATWISSHLVRTFLFFIRCLSTLRNRIKPTEGDSIKSCFQMLLESINSTDSKRNYCSLAVGTGDDRRVWNYQSRKLISLLILLFVLEVTRPDEAAIGRRPLVAQVISPASIFKLFLQTKNLGG